MKRSLMSVLLALSFATANAATFTVTNTNDSGPGSLRDAVAQANAAPGADTINFSVTGTILLTSGAMGITDALTITGPGAGNLTINGNANNRIFAIIENNAPACPALTGPSDYLVRITGLTLTNAHRNADNSGGAIAAFHSLVLDSVAITGSIAKNGGGVAFFAQYPNQSLTITNSQLLNNRAQPLSTITSGNNGGALVIGENCDTARTAPVTVTIANSLFSDNRAQPVERTGLGGAIAAFSSADITITDTQIINNHVDAPNPPVANQAYRGGGIYATAKSLTIVRSEIANNSNTDATSSGITRGGGIAVLNNAADLQAPASAMVLNITNSTVSGNVDTGFGGAMWVFGNVAVNVSNSTMSNNTAPAGQTGGIRITTGATNPVTDSNAATPRLTVVSTIIAGNTSDDIAVSFPTIPAFNLNASNSLGGTICSTCNISVTGTGNIGPVDPLLAPLAFNGGPTRTQALLAGSPAINAGSNPLNLTTDQRGAGFPRVVGPAADIGAYESATAPPPVVSTIAVPTLSEYALALLAFAVAGMGVVAIRRRS